MGQSVILFPVTIVSHMTYHFHVKIYKAILYEIFQEITSLQWIKVSKNCKQIIDPLKLVNSTQIIFSACRWLLMDTEKHHHQYWWGWRRSRWWWRAAPVHWCSRINLLLQNIFWFPSCTKTDGRSWACLSAKQWVLNNATMEPFSLL